MRKIIVLMALGLTGCSSAGPFVTNITSDGAGGLAVEKCWIHFNGWSKSISSSDCTMQMIDVESKKSENYPFRKRRLI